MWQDKDYVFLIEFYANYFLITTPPHLIIYSLLFCLSHLLRFLFKFVNNLLFSNFIQMRHVKYENHYFLTCRLVDNTNFHLFISIFYYKRKLTYIISFIQQVLLSLFRYLVFIITYSKYCKRKNNEVHCYWDWSVSSGNGIAN